MAIRTEIDTGAESKRVGKLGWFVSKTSTGTSPPREGEPVGTERKTESIEKRERSRGKGNRKKEKV